MRGKRRKEAEYGESGKKSGKKLDKPVLLCYNTDNKCKDGRKVAPQRLLQRGVGRCETQKTGRVNTLPEQRAEAAMCRG